MTGTRDDFDAIVREMGEQLDQHATLADLSRRSGWSPFHFHRSFTATVGETPKQLSLRIRLERAAYLVAVTDVSILRIALDVGFRSHETFTRAFRRRFDVTPTTYRTSARAAQRERLQRNASFNGDGCQLSTVQPVVLPPASLLCSRHTGAYADVRMAPFHEDDPLWTPLVGWAQSARIAHERTAWVMCLDDPTVTAGPQQRLDACIPLLGQAKDNGVFTVREFPGGRYAGVEHVGRHDTIIQAYRHVADWIRRSSTITFGEGAPVQIFRHVDLDPGKHRTEVFLPIVRRSPPSKNRQASLEQPG
jgi:AraC family transcriptional regulator